MKVSELTGAELDWYVAKAEGIENIELRTAQRATNRICVVKASGGRQFDYTYSPSTQWNVAGPIIERDFMAIRPLVTKWQQIVGWEAIYPKFYFGMHGDTILIAACRARVASVFGEEVEDI